MTINHLFVILIKYKTLQYTNYFRVFFNCKFWLIVMNVWKTTTTVGFPKPVSCVAIHFNSLFRFPEL